MNIGWHIWNAGPVLDMSEITEGAEHEFNCKFFYTDNIFSTSQNM